MSFYSEEFIASCKKKLLKIKEDILNELKLTKKSLNDSSDRGGDEIDQTTRISDERNIQLRVIRRHQKLQEVEQALARMEDGRYGICEETEEYIEEERLRAMPETSLSIEGAEIRENKREETQKIS